MEILTSIEALNSYFPYNASNYKDNFINLEVFKTIHDFCNQNPYIEKIYAKGSLIYGDSIIGSDIDHVRIQVNTPSLTLAEKKKIVDDLEHELQSVGISVLQRIRENNYIRVFYDREELKDFPLAYKLEDEIYPNLHVLKSKSQKDYIRKVLKRGYHYNQTITKKWIEKMNKRFQLLED